MKEFLKLFLSNLKVTINKHAIFGFASALIAIGVPVLTSIYMCKLFDGSAAGLLYTLPVMLIEYHILYSLSRTIYEYYINPKK